MTEKILGFLFWKDGKDVFISTKYICVVLSGNMWLLEVKCGKKGVYKCWVAKRTCAHIVEQFAQHLFHPCPRMPS